MLEHATTIITEKWYWYLSALLFTGALLHIRRKSGITPEIITVLVVGLVYLVGCLVLVSGGFNHQSSLLVQPQLNTLNGFLFGAVAIGSNEILIKLKEPLIQFFGLCFVAAIITTFWVFGVLLIALSLQW